MSYSAQNIRNICLLGHGGNGKTTLAESMLFLTGAVDRLGKVPDGNSTSDFDPEEIRRQISISASVIPVEYNGSKTCWTLRAASTSPAPWWRPCRWPMPPSSSAPPSRA